ncbi:MULTISPECIES: IMPACT family protein [Thermus]|uniref:YigZ family protein n=1 Tax=Thermus tengchongensis TaxID=1214928 RepID=A0A4Y9FFZ9_9DEIN|nr:MULTISPECIES: YigZ family protein [Thermus]TFU18045.1 YigZ family protein [Thermus tengchongensis]TFU27500.1 YigZ family protein [Thermus tengchongensis]
MAYTLAAPVVHEEIIQKSRFLAKAAPVASEEEALAFLAAQREPEATHNCYAYKIGSLYRFSDDGEPTGTAGKPILHAIEAGGLDRVVVLVVRYFGGVKLGAGGLVRAYGGVAAEALRRAPKVPLVDLVEVRFRVPFAEVGRVHGLLRARGLAAEETYLPEGVAFALRLPEEEKEAFLRALGDQTRGQAQVEG